jgi:monoterpene epsilon-lactone hydrolase
VTPAAERELAAFIAGWPARPMARSTTLADLRRNAEIENAAIPLPDGCVIEPLEATGITGERLVPKGADATGAILYHHGGGHVFGSPAMHRHLVARLAEAAGLVAFNMAYALAPEHPFPAGIEDALANYRFLIDQGIKPERIIVAGDSAGGNVTVAMLLLAAEAGLPQPGGVYLISPWLDLGPRTSHLGYTPDKDPLLAPDAIRAWSKAYRGDEHASHPRISPVFADVEDFPRTLIQVGGAEALLEDSLVFASKLALAGTDVQLNVWKDQVHAWPLFHADLPISGGAAIAQAGAWMRQTIGSGPVVSAA